MKKRIAKAFLILTAMLSFIYVYRVMGAKESSMALNGKSERVARFTGVIERADETERDLVVKKGDREMTFSWGDQTKFMRLKKELSFADVKTGMKVTVRYKEERDGKWAALRVYVHREETG
jgi:hypothetical protein